MTEFYTEARLEALREHVGVLAPGWGFGPRAEAHLLNISENATFRLEDPDAPDARPVVVRVHRRGYHSPAEIESELAWIDALRSAGAVDTPAVIDRKEGGRVAAFDHEGETRHAVAFAWMSGAEPAASAGLAAGFRRLGAISARLHAHAAGWTAPAGFTRKSWTWETTIGPAPHWGDWRAAYRGEKEALAHLERLTEALRARLAGYGTGPDRFGLVHADLRLANLLVDGDRLGVIDFDDCGFGWFAYDFAAAVSFHEHEPWIPELRAAWLEGYREVAPLPPEAEAILPEMVMLRRLLLTAWIASRADAPFARALLREGYPDGTLALAERHLALA